MKKVLAIILSLSMILTLGISALAAEEKTVLTMATSPDFPPFEELNADGSVVGIEVDLLNAICDKLGMELKIETMDFDSVLPGVQAGKFDAGVSGISVTEKRQKNVLFTDPYCLAAQAIVVKTGSEITGKDDLQKKKVSVQTGTTAESFCMENGYKVSSFQANSDAEMALVTGKVDAWVIDDLTAAEMVKAYNEDHPDALTILDEAMTTEPYAFAFAFGNEALVEKINGVLNEMVEDGTIAGLFEKYEAPFTSPLAE